MSVIAICDLATPIAHVRASRPATFAAAQDRFGLRARRAVRVIERQAGQQRERRAARL